MGLGVVLSNRGLLFGEKQGSEEARFCFRRYFGKLCPWTQIHAKELSLNLQAICTDRLGPSRQRMDVQLMKIGCDSRAPRGRGCLILGRCLRVAGKWPMRYPLEIQFTAIALVIRIKLYWCHKTVLFRRVSKWIPSEYFPRRMQASFS